MDDDNDENDNDNDNDNDNFAWNILIEILVHSSAATHAIDLDINDACRYLGYWGTGNGDMSVTREVVREKATVTRDLIKSHPLTPELSAELFAQKGIGAFRFSAALIEWSQSELESLQKIWVQAYKNA